MSDDIEEIKRRRLLELQKQLIEEERKRKVLEQAELQKQMLLKVILTPKARERLGNIKIVRPELAESLELQLIQLYRAGKIRSQVTDEQLKKVLLSIQSRRKEIRIKFK